MDNKPAGTTNIKQELRGIRILVAALITGVFMFLFVAVLVNQINGALLENRIEKFHRFIYPVMNLIALLALAIGHKIYQKRIRDIQESPATLQEKIGNYRSALVLYMAICEGMAILSVILFLLTGIYLLLIVAGGMLFVMGARLYSIKGVATELALNWDEQQQLD